MLSFILGGIFNFVKDFLRTLAIDTLVGIVLAPAGL